MNGRKMVARVVTTSTIPKKLLKILLHDIDRPISLLKDSSLEDDIINEENIASTENPVVQFSSISSSNANKNEVSSVADNTGTQLVCWGESLALLPLFTIREIEEHRLKSGKIPDCHHQDP